MKCKYLEENELIRKKYIETLKNIYIIDIKSKIFYEEIAKISTSLLFGTKQSSECLNYIEMCKKLYSNPHNKKKTKRVRRSRWRNK